MRATRTRTTDLDNPSLKVIADHIRACAFLIVDGVIPSSDGRGYVLRRIFRRAIRHGYQLGQKQPFFHRLVADLDAQMGAAYPELTRDKERVAEVLMAEEERFGETLENGMRILGASLDALARTGGTTLDGATAFTLYDTFGFPLDLTADICRGRGVAVDEAGASMWRWMRSVNARARRRPSRWAVGVALAILESSPAADQPEAASPIVTVQNPDPTKRPSLSVWLEISQSRGEKYPMVAAAFPNMPGLICDSWCYESELDFIQAKALAGGKLELRHRVRAQPQVVIVTTVTPEPGAVEFQARAELDRDRGDTWPAELLTPNLCWQLKRATSFRSRPEPYPEFVKRCFIFTETGRTFLHQTRRRPIPVRTCSLR